MFEKLWLGWERKKGYENLQICLLL